MSICPPCEHAADAVLEITLGMTSNHDPSYCRDLAIQPHGCTCQHDKGPVRPEDDE